ncbi:MAG: phosphate acetyltransferase [Candidatus Cyclobacteriaceae bacterium M3_2C_046]
MTLLEEIRSNAKKNRKKIVLPEGNETRTLQAADVILKEELADLVLLGNPDEIKQKATNLNLDQINKASIVDPQNNPEAENQIRLMMDLRKSKGLTYEEANKLIQNPLHLGAIMIKNGQADGEVAGAINATGDVLKPAFQYIKTKPGVTVVSGAFIMIFKDSEFGHNGIMVFADCAVNPDPDAPQLAQIAVETARTARMIAQIDPKIAMLSFSTKGSASHPKADVMIEATKLAQQIAPELKIDGELQADAAIIENIGNQKAPGSTIAGHANVLIFPDLSSGNIAYKLVQRMAHAQAIGPILQGMAAPVNDLSRGCSVTDIVNLVAITVNQVSNKS